MKEWHLNSAKLLGKIEIKKYILIELDLTLHNFYPFRREITKITQKRKLEIDNKLLTYAIQRTILFEQLLTKRFLGRSIPKPTPLPNQEEISDDDWKPFLGVISQCFDAHFDIYVNFTDL